MSEWILVFFFNGWIATAGPMTLPNCLKWQAQHKPEQMAVCIKADVENQYIWRIP